MEKFGLLALQGGGGSGLPPVTSADNGKVLAVENGSWAAADKSFLVVGYTITGLPSGDVYPMYTATSYDTIMDAWSSERDVIAVLTQGGAAMYLRVVSYVSGGGISFSAITENVVSGTGIAFYQITHTPSNTAAGLIIPLITGTMTYNSSTNTLAFAQ